MKKSLILVGLLLAIYTGFSQNRFFLVGLNTANQLTTSKDDEIKGGLFYIAGINFNSSLKWHSLNQFFAYYNTVYKPYLTKQLGEDFRFKSSFSHGFEFNALFFSMNSLWSKLKASTYSVLKNGDERHIDISLRTYSLGWDIVVPIYIVGIGAVFSLTQIKGDFLSGYKYKNFGVLSYAEDKELNGIYSLRLLNNFYLGGRLNFNFKYFCLILRFQKEMNSWIDEETNQSMPLYDKFYTTQTGLGIYSDGDFREVFPFAPQDPYNPQNGYNLLYKYPQSWYFSIYIGIGISNNYSTNWKL